MNNNQDNEIVVLIQDVIAGNAEKKELCNRIYKEVYALAYPVYQDEEKSMTQAKKALIEVCNRIEDINLSKNVHKQVATIVSAYFFVSAVSEYENELKNDYVMREYNYSRIREDEELLGYMKKKLVYSEVLRYLMKRVRNSLHLIRYRWHLWKCMPMRCSQWKL